MPARAKAAVPAPNSPLAIRAYARVLHKINPQMPDWQSHDLARHMLINANRWKIDANLLVALVTVESSWHTHAISNVGALGLGQLMPGTAQLLRVNPHDPYQNLQGAARYLHGLLSRFKNTPNRYALAFAAYNAGPKAVERYGGIPPFAQTQRYVVKVMSTWQALRALVHIPKSKLLSREPVLATIEAAPDVTYWAGTHLKR
ncbi:MAG TPA: lytic transglycosylase domain-containing protein [Candidatus Baltobacteraceae bacterium]|jgi:soluble lytic murein transglycosylase-like protein|nr:lytic transglycosylase domain-containing protein [Candidatus Baltobacteraceae bacterium]